MSGGNFASLTAGLLVRKGEAKPSPIMPAETFPFAQRVAPIPAQAPIPAGPAPQSGPRQLPAPSPMADAPAIPRRMFVQLSAKEFETLGLVAVKKGTTPQHLLRKALYQLFADFVEQCNGSCQCIQSGCDQTGQAL